MISKYRETQMIGWREAVTLPDLGLISLCAKADTGARTTALHATNITRIEINGEPCVEFFLDHKLFAQSKMCVVPIHHQRHIKNTSGVPEERFIITTRLQLGNREALIEVSLTDRSDMKFPIIIGRTTMRTLNFSVNPARSWLQSDKSLISF